MTRNHRLSTTLAALGLVLAIAALLFLSLWHGAYQGEATTASPDGGTSIVAHTSSSLIEENGLRILWFLAAPVALALAAFALSFWRSMAATWLMFALASMMVLFCIGALLSIGLFYLPATLLLLIAAFAHIRTWPKHTAHA